MPPTGPAIAIMPSRIEIHPSHRGRIPVRKEIAPVASAVIEIPATTGTQASDERTLSVWATPPIECFAVSTSPIVSSATKSTPVAYTALPATIAEA